MQLAPTSRRTSFLSDGILMVYRPDNKAQLIRHPPTSMAPSLLQWSPPQCYLVAPYMHSHFSYGSPTTRSRRQTWRGSSRPISTAFERRVNAEFAEFNGNRRSSPRSRLESDLLFVGSRLDQNCIYVRYKVSRLSSDNNCQIEKERHLLERRIMWRTREKKFRNSHNIYARWG